MAKACLVQVLFSVFAPLNECHNN